MLKVKVVSYIQNGIVALVAVMIVLAIKCIVDGLHLQAFLFASGAVLGVIGVWALEFLKNIIRATNKIKKGSV